MKLVKFYCRVCSIISQIEIRYACKDGSGPNRFIICPICGAGHLFKVKDVCNEIKK